MPFAHALVWIDHRSAKVLQFNATDVEVHKVHARTHDTRQHGSDVRTEHEFFAAVCDSLAALSEVLVTGPRTAQSDFRHYVTKHRPAASPQIIGWEHSDHETDAELVAMARRYFDRHARMAGLP
jgi:stalled ribosome rescue protein Dom34